MSEAVVDDIVAVLPPLLQSLEALSFIARYLNPPDFDRVMAAAGEPDTALRAVRPRKEWLAGSSGSMDADTAVAMLGIMKIALGWPLQLAALGAMVWLLARNHTPMEPAARE